MFLNPFHNALGLDIGDRSLKIVQLQRRRTGLKKKEYQVAHFSQIPLPPGWIVDGELQKPEEIIKALKNHLIKEKDHFISSPWAAASLPETKTYIQLIKLKNPGEGEITEEMVRLVAPSYLPYNLDDIYLDWQVIFKNEERAAVLVAAVPKRIADAYTYLLNIAGFTPLALEVEAIAIARAVINRRKDLSSQARGILDLGATRSSFMVFDKGVIQFSLSLPFAGLSLTEKIAAVLKVEWAEAEDIKKQCGVDQKKCVGRLKGVLEDGLDDLAEKISQAMQFYRLHFPEQNPVTGIRLCGGGANLPALENFLSAKLKLKVRRANPLVNLFSLEKAPLNQEQALTYATAIGLAMRAVESPLSF